MGGVLFDVAKSYTLSFLLAGVAGLLNLVLIGAIIIWKPDCASPEIPNIRVRRASKEKNTAAA